MLVGGGIVACSYLTLYLIPKEILEGDPFMIFFYINCLLLACILGVVFIGQGIAPYLNKFYLNVILEIMPKDKVMGPIIHKNMETHSLKNMKANLMYTIVITFLVFTGSNFK